MNNETWKDIVEYEGYYQVSDMGRVRSLRRGRVLVACPVGNGYLRVNLSLKGVRDQRAIHRLVAQAFVSNPLGLATVNHKDFNKTNNTASNLEWLSVEDNLRHAYPKRVDGFRVNQERARAIFLDYHMGDRSIADVAASYSVSTACVRLIVARKTWEQATRDLETITRPVEENIDEMTLRWKDVAGYEGRYQISSDGVVVSWRGDTVSPYLRRGYTMVRLARDDGDYDYRVHLLVAKAFLPNPNGYRVVHHCDHDRSNCSVTNLVWCTQSYNMRAAYAAGRCLPRRGGKNNLAKLSEEQVLEIRARYAQRDTTYRLLGEQYKVCSDTIRQIIKRHIWTHLPVQEIAA